MVDVDWFKQVNEPCGHLAELIREKVETYKFNDVGPVTISCGISTMQKKKNNRTVDRPGR